MNSQILMSSSFNASNPSVKRIQQEIREFAQDPSPYILAEALEENIFEWHFIVRGAANSEFEGGLYHGRILLPSEYPFKPPAFLMLTPNGRFEIGQKVCLSISSHHPEHWQPSWSVRTALIALVAFMQTPGGGAIASLDDSKSDRQELARQSRLAPPIFGSPARQDIINAAHAKMLNADADLQMSQLQPEPQQQHQGQQVQSCTASDPVRASTPATHRSSHPTGESLPSAPNLKCGLGSSPRAGQTVVSSAPQGALQGGPVRPASPVMPDRFVRKSAVSAAGGGTPVNTDSTSSSFGTSANPTDSVNKDASRHDAPVSRHHADIARTVVVPVRPTAHMREVLSLTAAAAAIAFLVAALIIKRLVTVVGAGYY